MKTLLPSAALTGLLVSPVLTGAELEITFEIPQIQVAEYHRPYAAIWIERADQSVAADLAVWYMLKNSAKGEQGDTWLKDLRTWWRKSGRNQTLPIDGVTGATRPPGVHKLSFKDSGPQLASLAPGAYHVVVEVAREVGGRELVRVSFQWPASKAPATAKAQGSHEIGGVQVTVKP
ncbi:MAG: DUF2271 domain-containing protein [Bryobacterales bacterium]|nr:DUF2271 domain-containing protein [Bryobacterales bacterium]